MGLDCYDERRDMRTFAGENAVVCHPPCAQWSAMRGLAKEDPAVKALALDCIAIIRKNGGVLEHPKSSQLFVHHLPLPGRVDEFGGYSILVEQHWWGHRCRKQTLLYIVGCSQRELPEIPYSLDAIGFKVGANKNKRLRVVHKREASATPVRFAEWLVEVAEICDKNFGRKISNKTQ
jgi:hypothetical protein